MLFFCIPVYYWKCHRLELTAARHNLGTKQAELTVAAEDMFNKSVHEDIDNRLGSLGARDEIRNVSLLFSHLWGCKIF